ncbi:MAG: DNA gyrase subunit A [bacterium]
MYSKGEKVVPINIEDEMRSSYIDYAMSVIIGRALPDVRDGLKPVHRRILHSMNEAGIVHNKPYKKSARVVGDVLGKYHPHGDMAVYESIVRMVQSFSCRYTLIDGQGNFGSVDGDSAAAMRYTEIRMALFSEEMLADIDKETVDFIPNYDESMTEPVVLPAKIPNLLVNGSSGIAVGMATNIPPHNMSEVIKSVIKVIDDSDVAIKEIMKVMPGPDFPTGAFIVGRAGIKEAYETGRGKITLRAKANIEQLKNDKENIIITELPYQINKARLIEDIAHLVNDKKIDGISDVRDESDRDGMRVVIELKRGEVAHVVLNQLYKHTSMRTTFGIIFLAIVDKNPLVLNIKEIIIHYINHRKEIIIRRTKFELAKAEARAHIIEGLKIALANLDEVIKTIKKSESPEAAKFNLMKKFSLSEVQALAILDMKLQKLTGLEIEKLEAEYLEIIKKIAYFKLILSSEAKVKEIIKEELLEIDKKFGDERRTEIIEEEGDFTIEDLIAEEDMAITISHTGYIKRQPVSGFTKQRRGGRGKTGMLTKEEDFVEHLFIASTHHYILFFTNIGKVHWIKVHEIPQAGRTAKGKAIINMLSLTPGERVTAFIPVKEFTPEKFLVMVTKDGTIKKTNLDAYSNPRQGGIIAITLDKDDELIEVLETTGREELVIATKQGKAVRFNEEKVRPMGRSAHGVRGVSLSKGDVVVSALVARPKITILTVTENGYGKRTDIDEYRLTNRGGKGVINIKPTARNGNVVGVKESTDTDELMIITSHGLIIRMPVEGINSISRNTQGVRLIRLEEGDKVQSIACIQENAADADGGEE